MTSCSRVVLASVLVLFAVMTAAIPIVAPTPNFNFRFYIGLVIFLLAMAIGCFSHPVAIVARRICAAVLSLAILDMSREAWGQEEQHLGTVAMVTAVAVPCMLYAVFAPRIHRLFEKLQYVDPFDSAIQDLLNDSSADQEVTWYFRAVPNADLPTAMAELQMESSPDAAHPIERIQARSRLFDYFLPGQTRDLTEAFERMLDRCGARESGSFYEVPSEHGDPMLTILGRKGVGLVMQLEEE